jgi:hypothetical protein
MNIEYTKSLGLGAVAANSVEIESITASQKEKKTAKHTPPQNPIQFLKNVTPKCERLSP